MATTPDSPRGQAGGTILVIGSTGKIGAELVRQLAAAGAPVRALVRSPAKAAAIAGPGVETAIGDLDDPASLDAALVGVDRMFLLSPASPRLAALQTNAVEAARRAGVRHIVKLGAAGVSLDSPIQVGRAHAEVEEAVRGSGIAWTFLRPTLFMQQLLAYAATIREQGAFYMPVRQGAIAMVDVRDIAAVAAAALTGPGHEGVAYELTGPAALTMDRAAEALSGAIGRPVRYVDVPPEVAGKGMLAAGVPDWFIGDLLRLMEGYAAGAAAAVSSAVEDATGRPARSFDVFAREHAHTFTA